MQHIMIHRLGPIAHCELKIKDFTVFTGPQASGKSTVAKSVFFFKNIKNLLFTQLRKQYFLKDTSAGELLELSIKNRLIKEIRSNFLQIFGSTWYMDNSMCLKYYYAENTFIRISLKKDELSPNYIWIEFSEDFSDFLNTLEYQLAQKEKVEYESFLMIKSSIDRFLEDDAEIVYIPAGRSMMTLLSTQLNYIYSAMDDVQKRSLDYCTQNYLERIMQMKSSFAISIEQMIKNAFVLTDIKLNREILYKAAELMREILQGEYRNIEGEERLQVSKGRYVKINFASSGQQEAVWILNVLFYYLLNNKKAYFIIEEPESHLFPNAQKLMLEFISLAKANGKNQIFITTHSPYILGTINNLLYAERISGQVDRKELEKIIDANEWISFQTMSAYFVDKGEVQECTDSEFESIRNEIIDGASKDINEDFDSMVLLKEKCLREEGEGTRCC